MGAALLRGHRGGWLLAQYMLAAATLPGREAACRGGKHVLCMRPAVIRPHPGTRPALLMPFAPPLALPAPGAH